MLPFSLEFEDCLKQHTVHSRVTRASVGAGWELPVKVSGGFDILFQVAGGVLLGEQLKGTSKFAGRVLAGIRYTL